MAILVVCCSLWLCACSSPYDGTYVYTNEQFGYTSTITLKGDKWEGRDSGTSVFAMSTKGTYEVNDNDITLFAVILGTHSVYMYGTIEGDTITLKPSGYVFKKQ